MCIENPANRSEHRCGNKIESELGMGDLSQKGGDYDFGHIWGSSVHGILHNINSAEFRSFRRREVSHAGWSLIYSVCILTVVAIVVKRIRRMSQARPAEHVPLTVSEKF